MASTYTPNLNLEKPANNDYVDSWDEVVNANMDKIDAATHLIEDRTDDPAGPDEGQQWIRSDLNQYRVYYGGSTYKIDLTAV